MIGKMLEIVKFMRLLNVISNYLLMWVNWFIIGWWYMCVWSIRPPSSPPSPPPPPSTIPLPPWWVNIDWIKGISIFSRITHEYSVLKVFTKIIFSKNNFEKNIIFTKSFFFGCCEHSLTKNIFAKLPLETLYRWKVPSTCIGRKMACTARPYRFQANTLLTNYTSLQAYEPLHKV